MSDMSARPRFPATVYPSVLDGVLVHPNTVTRAAFLKALDAYEDGALATLQAAVDSLALDDHRRIEFYHEPNITRTGQLAGYLPTALGAAYTPTVIDTLFSNALAG